MDLRPAVVDGSHAVLRGAAGVPAPITSHCRERRGGKQRLEPGGVVKLLKHRSDGRGAVGGASRSWPERLCTRHLLAVLLGILSLVKIITFPRKGKSVLLTKVHLRCISHTFVSIVHKVDLGFSCSQGWTFVSGVHAVETRLSSLHKTELAFQVCARLDFRQVCTGLDLHQVFTSLDLRFRCSEG